MHFSTLFSTGLVALQLSSAVSGFAVPKTSALETRAEPNGDTVPFPFDESDPSAIEAALKTIEDIPDSVLDDGDAAVKAWVTNHEAKPTLAVRDLALQPRQDWATIIACAGSIIAAIAENAFPLAKLRRL
ncbi:MAG: hypothetical protein Q9183_002522, partial [Haloplaca sp. 2 TL-2023]